jgi:hypothetical protein
VTTDELLDGVLIPRPNGSEGLERVAAFIASTLERSGATVTSQEFVATPYGFQLTWTAALLLMVGYVAAIATRRYGLALVLSLATPLLLLLEFELLRSPVSGLLPLPERNIVGTFPGGDGAPTLIFCAHYDTATHFGDHLSWGTWGFRQGPATALAIALAGAGLWRHRRGRSLPRALALPGAVLAALPFAAMFWFHAAGPVLREPSPGAIDNGGSVAALLRFSERLAARPPGAAATVRLVFLAAEEERALGSWAFARALDPASPVAVVNLESIGAAESLATIPEDGFALRRYRSPGPLVDLVNEAARGLWGAPLPPRELPKGTLTDGRSFLAHGIPAITLRAYTEGRFPRRLHSAGDSRDRLSVAAIERSAELLDALVQRVDSDPSVLSRLGAAPP